MEPSIRVSQGSVRKLADLQDYEAQNDPAGDGTVEGSDPFDLARLDGGSTLIADAAGNDLLVADAAGRVDWVATFPGQNGIQGGPDVGRDWSRRCVLRRRAHRVSGTAGRLARVASRARHSARTLRREPGLLGRVSGLTSIIELAFGPEGDLYVAQLDDAGWPTIEGGGGVGGSVHACSVATGACRTVVSGIPMLTSIAFRGDTLWGAVGSLVPGLADVVPLT